MYRSSFVGRRAAPVLIGVGGLQLVMGLFFALALGSLPYAGPGMVVTGASLGVVGVVLIVIGIVVYRKAADTDRVSQTGIAGVGQITGLVQTGTMVNYQPVIEIELLVTVPGHPPYPARVKEPVPLILLNRLQGSLPVRVDPARPEHVVIQWDRVGDPTAFAPSAQQAPAGAYASAVSGAASPYGAPAAPNPYGASAQEETLAQVATALAASGATAAPVFSGPGAGGLTIEQLRASLRANGLDGTARIDSLVDGGSTIGDERLFTMTATVSVPGRSPFVSGPSAAMVPLAKVPRVAVGVELPVKVAPDNDRLVMFEWDRI